MLRHIPTHPHLSVWEPCVVRKIVVGILIRLAVYLRACVGYSDSVPVLLSSAKLSNLNIRGTITITVTSCNCCLLYGIGAVLDRVLCNNLSSVR